MKRYLQCAEQQRLPSNITKYRTCHEKQFSWLILVTYDTLFTMRGAAECTFQHHQIYCTCHDKSHLNFTKDCARYEKCLSWLTWSHMKRYLQCAEQPKCDPPTSPNTAPATKKWLWLWWLILATYETLFTMRGATEVTLQHHQVLRLPRKWLWWLILVT